MKNYKSIICVVAAVCLLGTAAFCGFRIYHYYAEVDEQTETFEEIAEMVEQAPTDETVPDDAPVSEGEDVLAKYQELYLQNEDIVWHGFLRGSLLYYFGNLLKGFRLFVHLCIVMVNTEAAKSRRT